MATVTLTALDVITAVLESVTRAVRETAPIAVGVQSKVYGAVVSVPTSVAPAKKSTLVTVAAPTALAVAVSVTGVPRVAPEPAAGAVSAMLGAVTLTFTITDVIETPFESVTRAVRAVMPAAVGVQFTVKGADNAVPILVVPARKSTRLTMAPPLATAVAVSAVVVPSATDVPLVGTVMATVGAAAATVTLEAAEVAVVPFESVIFAVRETPPVAVGVQSKV